MSTGWIKTLSVAWYYWVQAKVLQKFCGFHFRVSKDFNLVNMKRIEGERVLSQRDAKTSLSANHFPSEKWWSGVPWWLRGFNYLVLSLLWLRVATVAWVRSLAWKLLHASGSAKKINKLKKKKNEKTKMSVNLLQKSDNCSPKAMWSAKTEQSY